MSESVQSIISVVVIGMIALVGLAVMGPVIGIAVDNSITDSETAVEPQTGESVVVDEDVVEEDVSVSVTATREFGLETDGTGYADADPPSDWGAGNWTVTAVARPDTENDAWNPKATHNVIAVDNETLRVDWDAGQWSVYYDENGSTALAQVPATADETPIVVRHNETADTISITADGATDEATLDADTEARNTSVNWVGMIDEVRFIDGQLTDSQGETFRQNPIDPLKGATHEARWMFDEGQGSTSEAYYGGSDASLVEAGWTRGVRDPGLEQGVDYELDNNPLAIIAQSDGLLDGAPVVYVNAVHPLGAALNSLTSGISSAFGLVPVLLLVILASIVVGVVARLQ